MQFVRESIFVAAVRSFCTSFSTLLGILISVSLFLFGLAILSTPDYLPEKSKVVIAPDANGNRNLLHASAPILMRLDFHGVIGTDDLKASDIQNMLLSSQEELFKGNRIKGILLHFNTPGGAAGDSNAIYELLSAYKKKYNIPVYAYIEDLCASGGMYIAAAADRIYASSSSVIGSIGTLLGPAFNVSQTLDKLGIQSLTITAGKGKDFLNPFRPWKPDEDQSIRAIVDALYVQFVDILTTARPKLDKQKLIEQYGASVFIAKTAAELGYIDVADSNYSQAVGDLATAAGIGEGKEYQVFQLKREHGFFDFAENKLGILSGKVTHRIQVGGDLPSELSGKFLYLYWPTVP